MAAKQRPELSAEAVELMGLIRDRYLGSGEFNGLHIRKARVESARAPAIELLEASLIQVMTGADYPNIHIRPWPSKRSTDDQIQDMRDLTRSDYGLCLYPTTAGMKGVRLPSRLAGRPFARAMARGKGTLELAYFQFDVLEQYRNDSRFRFDIGDTGASMGLSDEAFDDEGVFERDHVGLNHIGFAYDLTAYDPKDAESPIERRVAVFHCDLITLTPEHQRRWETYQVDGTNLEPHPLWWNSQMGIFPDGVGPFNRLFMELANLNELAVLAFDQPMFRSTERPSDMGWLLRPSQREWDDFVLQLDKVLSDNLQSDFFKAAGIEAVDERGQRLGTLKRFERFLQSGGVAEDRAKKIVSPMAAVREARQGPAHRIRLNITDQTFIHQQIELVNNIYSALGATRVWLATHPKCAGWEEKHKDLLTYML
ncbi:hypothetical protein JOF42_000523 [Microbacterium phyllosphaerae]|uniref:Uncharacterized protein n=1 Tax=Microbacterium phyllosphaerae TaxID=124798 RepID=A0ABS4WLL3_9MICO|nr:hypothetical protein [Microbacterium phyllosphaerae]MBP2377028.1 hypothetical protein [Microbacterium phyllosphaerae]